MDYKGKFLEDKFVSNITKFKKNGNYIDICSNTDDVDTLSNSIDIESSVFSAGNSQAFTANSKSIPTPTSTEGSDQSTAELGNSRRAFVPSGPSGEVEDIRRGVQMDGSKDWEDGE